MNENLNPRQKPKP